MITIKTPVFATLLGLVAACTPAAPTVEKAPPTAVAETVVTPTPRATVVEPSAEPTWPAPTLDGQPTPQPAARPSPTPAPSPTLAGPRVTQTVLGPVVCDADAGVRFTVSPLDPEDIGVIRPMGDMASSHVTPIDHIYIINKDPWRDPNPFVVRSPAAGRIIDIGRFPNDQTSPDGRVTRRDHRVVIAHSCTKFSIFIHLAELAPEVVTVTGDIPKSGRWSPQGGEGILVEAGQVIAGFQGSSIDYTLADTEVTLSGFVVPEHYDREAWKIHTVDPFDYFEEPARSQMLAFNPRTLPPLGGRIDYDVDGRAVGNWFLQGTVDYGGNVAPGSSTPYWTGHLAIAYDYIDPSLFRINVGRDTGIAEDACRVCQGTYGLKTGSPDPADVGVEDGLVKYELVELQHGPTRNVAGQELAFRVARVNVDSNVLGVALVQVQPDKSLKFEVVAGKTAGEVTGFSDAAAIYRR